MFFCLDGRLYTCLSKTLFDGNYLQVVLTEDVLKNLKSFTLEKENKQDWNNDIDVTVWINAKGNFKLTQNGNKTFSVYFSLYFTPCLIKNDLDKFEDLKNLYELLTNEPLL